MPKRITYQVNGKPAVRLPVNVYLSIDNIKDALIEEVYTDLSGTQSAQVVKDYCAALTRKRVEEKVSKWLVINGTQALSREQRYLTQEEYALYHGALDRIVDRLYPELMK